MDSGDFKFKEWDHLKSQIIRNTNMRRFSASNLKSFREDDERCSRTATTISSTVSSPGYTTRERIDPSTYSFTAALKALQSRNACSWELPHSEKLTLHSKWSDAEKYISNPFSGEVPLECLSAKTLGARSFRTLTNRITISAPLIYPSHHHFPTKFPIAQRHHKLDVAAQEEEKKKKSTTRDVGIQSAVVEDVGSGSRSPSTPGTPSIRERSMKYSEGESGDSSLSTKKEKVEEEEEEEEEVVEEEERERKEKEGRKIKGGCGGRERKKMLMMRMCSSSSSSQEGGRRRGCLLSFKGLWHKEKCKPKTNKKSTSSSSSHSSSPNFLYHINACYDD